VKRWRPWIVSAIPKNTQEDLHGVRIALERIAGALEVLVPGSGTSIRSYVEGDPKTLDDTGFYATDDEELAFVETAEGKGVTPEELYRMLEEHMGDQEDMEPEKEFEP